MSRYRLYPTPAQEAALQEHCAHARFVWNLAVEQRSWWRPGGQPAPGFVEQCRQLTEARLAFPWLAEGSVIVQQQALRDFHAARASWYSAHTQWRGRTAKSPPEERPSPPSPPSWRKRDVNEGFRIVAMGPRDARRLNHRWGEVLVPSPRRQVLPGDPGSCWPLARHVRGDPASDSRAGDGRGCRR